MNYRKSRSPLGGLKKTNARFVLIASCVIAVLLSILAAPPYTAHAQQGHGDPLQTRGESPAAPLATPTPGRRVIADFDGDGKSDISVWRDSDGNWYWINSSNSIVAAFHFGSAGDRIVPGDYDGDGKTDFAVFRPSSGTWFVSGSTAGFSGTQFGLSTDLPAQGDFDGDGKTDISVFRPSTGTWYILRSTAGFLATQFGANGDKPVVGDYDGDGKADIAVYRPTDGNWYQLRSTAGFAGVHFGIAADNVVPGDYDGDAKTDLAVYRDGSPGVWYLLESSAGFVPVAFGTTNDIPAPADFDGDGKADISVFRPSSGTWFQQRSTSGFLAQQFGQNGDKPVPAGYVPTPTPTPSLALTEEQRMAVLDALSALFESLSANPDRNAVNQALLDFIRTRPEFAEAGLSDDSCVWATFTDGVEFTIFNNRDPSNGPIPVGTPAVAITSSANLNPENLPDSSFGRLIYALGPAFINSVPQIRPWLQDQNYSVPSDGGTVDEFKQLGNVGAFYIDAHGGGTKYGISTTTEVTLHTNQTYKNDLFPDANGKVNLGIGLTTYAQNPDPPGGLSIKKVYYLRSEFIRKYWTNPKAFSQNSFFFNDACNGASPAASDFRAALKEAGVSVYAGWTRTAYDDDTVKFVFDRLLGANKIYPESDGFQQRPFDYQSVKQDLTNHGLGKQPNGAELQFIPLAVVPNSEGFRTLAPSIWRMRVDEYSTQLQLQILGLFGDDPGESNRAVYVESTKLNNCLWTAYEIDCDLPVAGAGSSGEVIVIVRNQKSNVAHLTEFEGDFTHTVMPTTTPPGNQKQTVIYHVRFRGDIRYARTVIHNPPTFLLPGEFGRALSGPTADSSLTYMNSGSYTETLPGPPPVSCTYSWSGSGTFVRGSRFAAIHFDFPGWFKDDRKVEAQLWIRSMGLIDTTACTDGAQGQLNRGLITPSATDAIPDTFNIALDGSFNSTGNTAAYTDVLFNVHTMKWTLNVKPGTAPNPNSPR